MTPVERQNSIEKGLPYDRVPCVPFIGNMRCLLLGIGPKVYEKFVYPYTKELTDYIYEKTGKKASLHMCGETYSIWKYIKQYQLNEISLDNVVDLERAANELGEYVPIAGNVDPVQVVMKGTKQEIFDAVQACIENGRLAKAGYHLTTGCDISDGTAVEKMDWFMEAARAK